LIAFVLLLLDVTIASAAYKDGDVIQYAKALDVAILDASVPSQRLDEWLLRGPSQATTVRWRTSDCDLKHEAGTAADRRPLCVKFTFISGNVSGWGLITVGTAGKGITGKPRFEHAVVTTPDLARRGQHETVTVLSQLPHSITKHKGSSRGTRKSFSKSADDGRQSLATAVDSTLMCVLLIAPRASVVAYNARPRHHRMRKDHCCRLGTPRNIAVATASVGVTIAALPKGAYTLALP
jgi:hypothetical protein